MQEVWKQTISLSAPEVDFQGRWKLSAVLLAMQEVSECHSKHLGVSRSDLIPLHIAWVLLRTRIVMDSYPVLGEEVLVTTWAQNQGRRIYNRHYTFSNAKGEVLGRATTVWLLMNIETRRIIRAPENRPGFALSASVPPVLPEPKPLRYGGEMQEKELRAPRYSDLDINGHMNNTRYAEWICDLFPAGQYERETLTELQINYLIECVPGEDVRLELGLEGEQFFVKGTDVKSGRTHFEAAGKWKEKTL